MWWFQILFVGFHLDKLGKWSNLTGSPPMDHSRSLWLWGRSWDNRRGQCCEALVWWRYTVYLLVYFLSKQKHQGFFGTISLHKYDIYILIYIYIYTYLIIFIYKYIYPSKSDFNQTKSSSAPNNCFVTVNISMMAYNKETYNLYLY